MSWPLMGVECGTDEDHGDEEDAGSELQKALCLFDDDERDDEEDCEEKPRDSANPGVSLKLI
jgi:hypothetical protein